MTITRVSTLGLQQSSLSDVKKIQADLFKLQGQISSQYKSQDFAGLNGQVEQYTALNSKLTRGQAYLDNNSIVLSRIRQTGIALDQMTDIATSIETLIMQRRDPAIAGGLPFEQQIKALRTTLANSLSANVQGRYLFSGTKTDTPPIKENIPDPASAGVPDNSYYQGSSDDLVALVDDGHELTYNIRADESAFQKIFASIAQAIAADNGNSDAGLQQAQELVKDGLEELIALSARNNANQVNLEQINERHTSLKLYWQGVTEEIAKTDLVAASTQVAVDQSVLQATFQVFARINSLHLVDFLN